MEPRLFHFRQGQAVLTISQEDLKNIINRLIDIMKEEVVGLGYALRRQNARFDDSNRVKRIILQNVLENWAAMRYDLPLERTAAVVHLQSILMTSRLLHAWKLKLLESPNFREYWKLCSTHLKDVKLTLDLRADIWELGGTTFQLQIQVCMTNWKREIAPSHASTISSPPHQGAKSLRDRGTWNIFPNGMFF